MMRPQTPVTRHHSNNTKNPSPIPMNCTCGFLKMCSHHIINGLVKGKIYRKPWFVPKIIGGKPVDFLTPIQRYQSDFISPTRVASASEAPPSPTSGPSRSVAPPPTASRATSAHQPPFLGLESYG